MSNATGGTFRAVVSDTDFSVAVGIIVALAVVSFLPLIAVIIRLLASKAVQPMSKNMTASERLAHSRRAAKRSTLAVRGVSIALGWLLICWGWGPWILPRSVYVAPFFATMPMWHLGFSLILLSLTPDARWGTFVMSILLTALCAAQFRRNSAQLLRHVRRPTRAPAQVLLLRV